MSRTTISHDRAGAVSEPRGEQEADVTDSSTPASDAIHDASIQTDQRYKVLPNGRRVSRWPQNGFIRPLDEQEDAESEVGKAFWVNSGWR
jgi:hypothetical protein